MTIRIVLRNQRKRLQVMYRKRRRRRGEFHPVNWMDREEKQTATLVFPRARVVLHSESTAAKVPTLLRKLRKMQTLPAARDYQDLGLTAHRRI